MIIMNFTGGWQVVEVTACSHCQTRCAVIQNENEEQIKKSEKIK